MQLKTQKKCEEAVCRKNKNNNGQNCLILKKIITP